MTVDTRTVLRQIQDNAWRWAWAEQLQWVLYGEVRYKLHDDWDNAILVPGPYRP